MIENLEKEKIIVNQSLSKSTGNKWDLKKAYWIPLLIALAFAGDRIGGYILGQLVDNSQFRYSRLYNGSAEADILMVGNSRGLMFYQPYIEEITEKSTFNLSYNAMPMNLGQVFVEDYLELYPIPKKLLIEVTCIDRLNNPLISEMNTYSPYSERLDQLILDTLPTTGYGGRFANLYRYNSEVFYRSLNYINQSDENWLLDREINDYMIQQGKNLPAYTIDIPEGLLESLKNTVKVAKENNLEVELIVAPYFKLFKDKITNMPQFIETVSTATGLPVRDYSDAIEDRKHFGDYQHVNKSGAKMFLDLLQKDGVLPIK